MRARRTAVGAMLVTSLTLAASNPETQAAEKMPVPAQVCRTANHNKANRLAGNFVRRLGSKVINFRAERVKGGSEVSGASSINTKGMSTKTVTIDTGASSVSGSNGEYTVEVSSVDVGSNGRLDISDVNRLKVEEGSWEDGQPLFALSFSHTQKPWVDGPADANCWWGADGTAVKPSGQRVIFDGSTDPSPFATPPGLVLDRGEISATGRVMDKVLLDALNGAPTELIEPPFRPQQPVNSGMTPVP